MIEWLLVGVGVLLIGACAAFVAFEFALVTVDRATVERRAAADERGAPGVLAAMRTLSTQLSGAQLGITITNLAIGFVAEPSIAALLAGPLESLGLSGGAARSVSITLALVLATVLTMVFGELVPKNLAIAKPFEVARTVSGFQRGFTRTTAWVIRGLNGSANAILRRLFGVEPQEELASARSPEELTSLVRRSGSTGTLAAGTAALLERGLAFGELRASDVATRRGQMTTVGGGEPVTAVLAAARESGHSRFPVLSIDGVDDVIGLVHVKHAFAIPRERRREVPVADVMVEALFVPTSRQLDDLLLDLRRGSLQMAVVVDEYGGTDGVVTIEDLVEELVGDLTDEHDDDADEVDAIDLGDGTWSVSGLLRPDEVAAVTGLTVPGDRHYDTLGGLVLHHLGRIPEVGDRVEAVRQVAPEFADEAEGHPAGSGSRSRRWTAPGSSGPASGNWSPRTSTWRPTVGDWLGVLLAVVLLGANAFFVGAEFALISARRSSIEPLAEAGSRRARTTLRAMEQVSMMMAGAQLGITVCSLGLGAIGEPAVAHLLEPVFEALRVPEGAVYPVSFVLALGVVVALHVVVGEMVPKNLALAGPDRAALALAPPLAGVVTVLKPVIRALNALANGVLRLLGVAPKAEVTSSFTRDEVAGLLDESRAGGLLDAADHDLLTGALTLEDRDTRTVLIPRAELTVLSPDDDARAVERASAETGFSRFPVVTDGELTGYVHVKDVLVAEGEPDVRVADITRPLPRVDAAADLRSTLQTMQADRAQLAAVVDAGRVVGVVALEDILEELVGEIRDSVHR